MIVHHQQLIVHYYTDSITNPYAKMHLSLKNKSSPMNVRIVFILCALPILTFAQTFSYPWAINGNQPGDFATCQAIAKDMNGNSFLAINHSESLQFGSVTLGVLAGVDVGIVKFNSSGIAQWGAVATGPGADGVTDIACDAAGNVYVSGWFDDSLQLGPIKLLSTNPVFGDNRREFFVACLNSEGVWQWARKQTGAAFSEARAIGIDADGNCVVGGIFYGANLVVSGQTLQAQEMLPFIVKYTSAGTFVWLRSASTPYGAELTALDIGNDGTIYYTGSFGTAEDEVITMTFGTIVLTNEGDPEEGFVSADAYVAALSSSGNYLWANNAGALYTEAYGLGIVCDENGNTYICGSFYQSMNAGDFSVETADGEFHQDIFIAMLNSSGQWMWLNSYGNMEENIPSGMRISSDQHVYLFGEIGPTPLNFDGEVMITSGQNKSYIARVNADGTIRWAFAHPQVAAFAPDVQNTLFITGMFAGNIQLGDISLNSTGGTGRDVYVTRLDYTPLVPDKVSNGNKEDALSVYPNPSNGLFRIKGLSETFTYMVSDLRGQIISSGKISNEEEIDLTMYSNGMYLLRITSQNKETSHMSIIKSGGH